jgi:putative oxidoreductase
MNDPVALTLAVGHFLLGSLFVVAGIRHMFILPTLVGALVVRGLPFAWSLLLVGTAFQIIAGVSLAVGLYVPFAALGLVGFTVVASVLMLDFWNQDGARRAASINAWQSNAAVVGGLLLAATHAMQRTL